MLSTARWRSISANKTGFQFLSTDQGGGKRRRVPIFDRVQLADSACEPLERDCAAAIVPLSGLGSLWTRGEDIAALGRR
jgi:hypothetical protein